MHREDLQFAYNTEKSKHDFLHVSKEKNINSDYE